MRAIGVLLGLGIGVSVAAVLWPIMLGCALAMFIKWMIDHGRQSAHVEPTGPAPKPEPVLRNVRARALAVVHQRNKEHLERCYNQMF